MTALQDQLRKLHACGEAIEWVGDRDLPTAWAECRRGDWMLWLAGKLAGPRMSDSRRPLALAACECARLALRFVPEGEARPADCIALTELWARGQSSVTRWDLRDAAAAAYSAYATTAAAAAAAYSAYATTAAAAAAAAYVAARASTLTTLAQCADIVRKQYPTPPVIR